MPEVIPYASFLTRRCGRRVLCLALTGGLFERSPDAFGLALEQSRHRLLRRYHAKEVYRHDAEPEEEDEDERL